jgi:drug/metabolite transporter (DMT)-like permease
MRLIVIAIGIIYGFLILTATTITSLPSAHSGIVLGILPLATAMFGVLRFKEDRRTTSGSHQSLDQCLF